MHDLGEIAQYPNSFMPLGSAGERIETERYTLCLEADKHQSTVQRQRFGPDEIDDVRAEVHALLRERGRDRTQWEVGSEAEALVEPLLARGLVRDREPFAVALVLTEPPPRVERIEARRVASIEEFVAATELQRRAFGLPEAASDELRRRPPEEWREGPIVKHAAWLDGELVAAGTAAASEHGLLLFGGATLPHARGRGAYRALVRARWDDAVELGTPALLTQAGALSRPILERAGFERVGHVHLLVDLF